MPKAMNFKEREKDGSARSWPANTAQKLALRMLRERLGVDERE